MRILFRTDDELICAQISTAIYNAEENELWFSINDSTLLRTEITIEDVPKDSAKNILLELYTTGMYDFSNSGLHVEYC